MAGQRSPATQNDFSGGVNLASNPYTIGQKQAWRMRNLILDENGSFRTRPGVFTIGTAPVAQDILMLGVLNKTTGASKRFGILASPTTATLYDLSTAPWTSVSAFAQRFNAPMYVQMTDKIIFGNGYETPKTWDGTTFATMSAGVGQTVPPGAKHLAFHLGSLWVWNTNPTTTTLDGPSSLRMSGPNDPADWPNANQVFISKDDGQVGMGLATFTIVETGISPVTTLVVFKNYSSYQVTGIFGSSNFSIQRTKSDLGCVSPRTIQFVSGFGIIRMTHKGFALFDGVNDKLISEDVRPAIFGLTDDRFGENIAAVNFDQIATAWAGQVQNPPLYVAALPVTGTNYLTRLFVFDLVRKAWTIVDIPYNLTTLAVQQLPTAVQLEGGTASAGAVSKLLRLFSLQDTTDDGTPVEWRFRSKLFHHGSPTMQSYWRRVEFELLATPTKPLVMSAFFGSSGQSRVKSKTWTSLITENILELGLNVKSPAVTFTLSGAGPVKVRGLSIDGRGMSIGAPKRNR